LINSVIQNNFWPLDQTTLGLWRCDLAT